MIDVFVLPFLRYEDFASLKLIKLGGIYDENNGKSNCHF